MNTITECLQSKHRVEGLTHNFYRYPARFSPEFAREVILTLSRKGDAVLDIFMGGGTTIVEALASGRVACGIDINSLSHFVTRVKTTPLSSADERAILDWLGEISPSANARDTCSTSDSRLRNIPDEAKRFFHSALLAVEGLRFPRQRRFARCALMRLGQWAMDCGGESPTWGEMKSRLLKDTAEMLHGLSDLVSAAGNHGIWKSQITGRRFLYLGSVNNVLEASVGRQMPKPTLVLTSPPYPGVHVLYHRWQIRGRRETPAPYWLAGLRDGHGESYYTLGGRSRRGQREYFRRLTQAYCSLRSVIDSDAVVVQLVGFSEPESQLPMFLDSMASAGYEELRLLDSSHTNHPCRQVPNRKWYAHLGGKQPASHEILVTHRPSRGD